jgi:hypothetical protein
MAETRRMMLSRSALFVLLIGFTGCDAPDAPSRGAGRPTPAPVPAVEAPGEADAVEPAAPVGSLAGAWRVAGIDGAGLDEPVGLALTGDERQLWWEPRCAGAARAYRIEGARISFASTGTPRPAGAPTPPVCAIGLPPRLGDVMRALDEATSITRTESNGVLIAGPRHSVTLYSQ